MRPYRVARTTLPSLTRTVSNSYKPNMSCVAMYPRPIARPFSFAPRGFPFPEVDSLFRLLDDASRPAHHGHRHAKRTFQPRFDVRESPEAFHLQGELPGLSQQDVQIEFADRNTLTVHGRVARESQQGDPALASTTAESKVVADAPADAAESISETSSQNGYHKATVEDETADAETATATAPATPATTNAEPVEKTEVAKTEKDKVRYWVSERSLGEFHRSFTFPGHVDHDNVKASLKNGILNVEVPKAQPQEPRRIQVE